jgi:hypothetical protein
VNEAVRDTIAFGRRSAGDPGIFYPSSKEKLELTKPEDWEVGNNFYRNQYVEILFLNHLWDNLRLFVG